ncbi:hypothetical protein KC330_g6078 [Hortaea werneckii]|nr:hypothetical protein KC330_g6078 [Hortaea werneckii]
MGHFLLTALLIILLKIPNMANKGRLLLTALLFILLIVSMVTSPSTKTTTELLSGFDFIASNSPAVLLEVVFHTDGQEKDPRTKDLVSITTTDICVPALRWRISRDYRNPRGLLATTFDDIPVGWAVSYRQLRITVGMFRALITLVLLQEEFLFDDQHGFSKALATFEVLLGMFFSDDTVLFAIRSYIVRG